MDHTGKINAITALKSSNRILLKQIGAMLEMNEPIPISNQSGSLIRIDSNEVAFSLRIELFGHIWPSLNTALFSCVGYSSGNFSC